MDPALILGFIIGNKEIIEHNMRYNLGIEKIVIYKPIWLNELRTKVQSLLSHQQQQKEDKSKLSMMIAL
jgi:hypothetical protein